jgi:hypothetical protein
MTRDRTQLKRTVRLATVQEDGDSSDRDMGENEGDGNELPEGQIKKTRENQHVLHNEP